MTTRAQGPMLRVARKSCVGENVLAAEIRESEGRCAGIWKERQCVEECEEGGR